MAIEDNVFVAAADPDRLSAVPLVVSLSPSISRELDGREIGHTYQYACLQAWKACGFRVISVNAAPEAELVGALYPDIEIVVVESEMMELCGKPLVPLSEMIRVLVRTGVRIGGIVNSDVFLPPCNLATWLSAQREHELFFLRRREISHPMLRDGPLYRLGFDAFFFDTRVAAVISCDPFTIGLPWWDYLLPTSFVLAGRKVAEIEGLSLLHFSHHQKWDEAVWLLLFNFFRERFAPDFAAMAMGGDRAEALVSLMFEDQMYRYHAGRAERRRDAGPPSDVLGRYRTAYAYSVVDLIMQKSEPVAFDEGQWAGAACR